MKCNGEIGHRLTINTSRLRWEDKVKVQLFLCLINEFVWGSGGIGPSFLTLALDGSKWSASQLCTFTLDERACDTYWIEGCVSPRACLGTVEKRKFLSQQGIETQPYRPHPVIL
jgi:hypothetical protein